MSAARPAPRVRSIGAPSSHARWLVAYGVTTLLSFPHPFGHSVLDLGAALAWLGPACLLLALRDLPPRRAAVQAFIASWLAHAAILHWIYGVTVTYGHAPPVVGVLAPLALSVYIALFTALFAAIWRTLDSRGAAGALPAALLWVVCDHLRSFALSGFPWATLGYAQHHNRLLLPLASVTGVYGLSFVTALGAAALAGGGMARREGRAVARADALALIAVLALHPLVWGLATFRAPVAPERVLRVAVVQGNIDQSVKWSRGFAEHTLAIYERLSREVAARGARLIVWPETAAPGAPERDAALRGRLSALARETHATYVIGAVGTDRALVGERPARYFDSAFVVAPDGRFTERYDKAHLVPFGEYVPLRPWLGHFIGTVASGIASLDVSAGPAPRAVAAAGVRVGLPICYELLFPDLVRRFVADGARVLFAITNDAWYGRTGAPYQFLAMTALRSAETGVWTVRAANTGVSAIIDSSGRVRKQTSIFEEGTLVADVPLADTERSSFYARHGDLFAMGCWLGLAAVALRARRRGGRKSAIEAGRDGGRSDG